MAAAASSGSRAATLGHPLRRRSSRAPSSYDFGHLCRPEALTDAGVLGPCSSSTPPASCPLTTDAAANPRFGDDAGAAPAGGPGRRRYGGTEYGLGYKLLL
jgi:hypothetical protein